MAFSYEYPRPALTWIAWCSVRRRRAQAAAHRAGPRALPGTVGPAGGFCLESKRARGRARRELQEETGIREVLLEQFTPLARFDAIRASVVSVATSPHPARRPSTRASTDARQAVWFDSGELPKLAFDHEAIIEQALEYLRKRVRLEPIGFQLWRRSYLTQLQTLYESVLGRQIDPATSGSGCWPPSSSFRSERVPARPQRPAQPLSIRPQAYEQLKRRGFISAVT